MMNSKHELAILKASHSYARLAVAIDDMLMADQLMTRQDLQDLSSILKTVTNRLLNETND